MNIFNNKKTYIQKKISSTAGRLFIAFLMVMSLIGIFGNKSVVNAGAYNPVDVHITFDCKEVDGIEKNSYKISIKSETGQAPDPKNDTVTVNKSGKGEFVVPISEPGTYEYKIYQIKGSEKSIKYDETKYDVIVGVFTSENGELSYSVAVTLAGTDDKPESFEFENGAAGAEKTTETDTRTEETSTEDVSEEETTEAPPGKIDKPDNQGKNKTADESKLVLMMIILVVSLTGTVVVGIKRKNKEV